MKHNNQGIVNLRELKNEAEYSQYFHGTDKNLMSKFLTYHSENPRLWNLFEKFALEAKRKGRGRFSIWMIANRIRWYTQVETTGQEFKVSNDYLALYARFLMLKHDELKGMFMIKTMKRKRSEARQ